MFGNTVRRLHAALVVILVGSLAGGVALAGQKTGTITGKLQAKKKKYRRDAVVYLAKVPGKHRPPKKGAEMDQINQKFVPHVLPVVKGTKVRFRNSDNTGHNVYTPDGEKYDLGTWKKGGTRTYTFKKEGVYTQLCKLHPSMLAYVVSLQNPYYAVTGADGSFTIKGVPPGTYTVKVWHERRRADPVKVTVKPGATVTLSFKMKR